jgi:hypothetical protein
MSTIIVAWLGPDGRPFDAEEIELIRKFTFGKERT